MQLPAPAQVHDPVRARDGGSDHEGQDRGPEGSRRQDHEHGVAQRRSGGQGGARGGVLSRGGLRGIPGGELRGVPQVRVRAGLRRRDDLFAFFSR